MRTRIEVDDEDEDCPSNVYAEILKLKYDGGFALARSEHFDRDLARGLAYFAVRFETLGELLNSVVAAYEEDTGGADGWALRDESYNAILNVDLEPVPESVHTSCAGGK